MPESLKFMIVHISDLHFAEELCPRWTSGGSRHAGPTPSVGAQVLGRFAKGVSPHDIGACEDLENEIKQLLRDHQPPQSVLVVSGDLTRSGDDSEFTMALTYLRDRLRRYWTGGHIGLGSRIQRTFAVPGNHDHWTSYWSSMLTRWSRTPSPIHGVFFRGPHGQPWWHETLAEGGIQLQLMGIDSSDVSGLSLVARGYIDNNALAALAAEVSQADRTAAADHLTPVRVLVVHHSLDLSVDPFHSLDSASRASLVQFCGRNGVHFVLTGHTHEPNVPLTQVAVPPVGEELRCGTTLQGALPGKPPSRYGNVFLVHHVIQEDSTILWRTETYQRRPPCPFRKVSSAEATL